MLPTSKLGKAILGIVTIVCIYLTYNSLLAEQSANKEIDQFHTDCVEGSDCYYIELTMYNHPSWSYDKAEDYVFLSDSLFNVKYNEK